MCVCARDLVVLLQPKGVRSLEDLRWVQFGFTARGSPDELTSGLASVGLDLGLGWDCGFKV